MGVNTDQPQDGNSATVSLNGSTCSSDNDINDDSNLDANVSKKAKLNHEDQAPISIPNSELLEQQEDPPPQPQTPPKKGVQPKKGAKKRKKEGNVDSSLALTWICTECREAECATQPDSPLLLCEGPCSRPFHYPCAGLADLPPADEEWWCNDCKEKRHQCAVCHEYGADQVDVYKCGKLNCGLFFHESCLNMYDVDIEVTEVRVKDDTASTNIGRSSGPDANGEDMDTEGDGDGSHIITVPKFQCPAHDCWTCSRGMPPRTLENDESDKKEEEEPPKKKGKKGKKGKRKRGEALCTSFMEKKEPLFRCLECPNAYHISCIPPHAVFHELALLCHEHSTTSKLPYLDVKESLQGRVEDKTDKLIERITNKKTEKFAKKIKNVDGSNMFLFGMKGDRVTPYDREVGRLFATSNVEAISRLGKLNLSAFCTPCTIQKEVHSKPPVYTHIHSNRYNPQHRPKRHPPSSECCQCKPKNGDIFCDEHCMNRMMGIECVGNGKNKSGIKNPYWNCNLGPECGNRKLSRRQFAKCKPKREQGKGWGLITVNGVKQGGLIQEYVGDIIDEKTKRERLESWAKDHPNDPNFYIMSLESGWYIDAREKGNLSRFINHSCGPNCHLVPVNVGGYTRVAIIAKRDIRPGEFLCYDYQFDTKDSDKFLCRCGAPNCRGTMKGGLNHAEADEKKKTKKDIWIEAKANFDKNKKFLKDVELDQIVRLHQVGACLPGDIGESARAVASLPSNAFRMPGTCLWRNTMVGSDFSSRYLRTTSPKKKPRPKISLPKVDVFSQIN